MAKKNHIFCQTFELYSCVCVCVSKKCVYKICKKCTCSVSAHNDASCFLFCSSMSDKSELKAELERKKQRLAQIREEKKRKEEERKKKEVRTCIQHPVAGLSTLSFPTLTVTWLTRANDCTITEFQSKIIMALKVCNGK